MVVTFSVWECCDTRNVHKFTEKNIYEGFILQDQKSTRITALPALKYPWIIYILGNKMGGFIILIILTIFWECVQNWYIVEITSKISCTYMQKYEIFSNLKLFFCWIIMINFWSINYSMFSESIESII